MKKIIVSILAATCALSSLAAFTWSGLIDNNTKFSANHDFSALGLNQSNGIYLSAASKLNESGTLRFNAEGLYKYYLNCDLKEGESTFKNIVDLDLLKLTGEFSVGNGVLGLGAGRFKYSDYSGAVFSQVSDGLYLNYNTQKIKVSLYGGYTGLLNRLNVSMIENEYEEDENFYALCPKYVPVTADFEEADITKLQGKTLPYVEYNFTATESTAYEMIFYMSPTTPVSFEAKQYFGYSLNNEALKIVNTVLQADRPFFLSKQWEEEAISNIKLVKETVNLQNGFNTLRVFAVSPQMIFEKIVLHKASIPLPQSYLGPVESYFNK